MDAITIDAAARLVHELRAERLSKWTIATILKAANRVFVFAKRRCCWHGENPVAALDKSERPKPSTTARRRIFQGDELAQTLAAAHEPFKTLFALAAVTGARLSECLGVTLDELDLSDLEQAMVTFQSQYGRQTRQREPLKTAESRRVVDIPRSLAVMLKAHMLRSAHSPQTFLFCTRSGRPLGHRNVARELRRAMTAATDDQGRPTFPVLHVVDERGKAVKPPRGSVPSFHGFRHTAASEAIAAGDGAEEVSWQLGHKDSTVTRRIYVQEIKNAERRARRKARMEDCYGAILEAATSVRQPAPERENVVQLARG